MSINFTKKFNNILYVQLWEKRLKVTDVISQKCFDENPVVAFTTNAEGKKVITGVGNRATDSVDTNTRIVNPFSHPRMLIADFYLAEKILAHAISKLFVRNFLAFSPIIVMHPMEKVEGGLSEIESRCLQELAMGAGAREAYIHVGAPLSTTNFNMDLVTGNRSPARASGSKLWKPLIFIILLLVIWYTDNI